MLAALVAMIVFLIGIMATAMIIISRAQRTVGKIDPFEPEKEAMVRKGPMVMATCRHISDLIQIEMHESGIFSAGGIYVGLARLSGTNFDVMSEAEQNAREDALIGIQNQIKYPIKYITSTVITDTDTVAREIRANAAETSNVKLAQYSNMYARELEEMKRQRRAMAQVTWIAISDTSYRGNPVDRIREKMSLLQEAFRTRAGSVLTPLISLADGMDALKEMMLPERLSKPSEVLMLGGVAPIKFNVKEVEKIS